MLYVMSCGHLYLVYMPQLIIIMSNYYVTPFVVAITGKPALTIDCISHPALKEPYIRYYIGFSLDAFTKIYIYMFCYPLLGLLSGLNNTLTIACIGYSVLGEH